MVVMRINILHDLEKMIMIIIQRGEAGQFYLNEAL